MSVGFLASCFSKALERRHEITAGSWEASFLALPRKNPSKMGHASIREVLSQNPEPAGQVQVGRHRLVGKMNPEKREHRFYLASSHFTQLSCFHHPFTVCKGLTENLKCCSQILAEGRLRKMAFLDLCLHYRQKNRKAAFGSGLEMSARVCPGLTGSLA